LIDMPDTASRFIPLKRAGAYRITTGIRQLAQALTEPLRRCGRIFDVSIAPPSPIKSSEWV
jgi:hypothetical protein